MRYPNRWTIGEWTFYQVEEHGFSSTDGPLYGYATGADEAVRQQGEPNLGELYPSLEHAMVAAVGEKFTGPRGAGGTGVGTAADWFMRMVGAYQVVPADDADRRLTEALAATDSYRGPLFRRGQGIADWLARHGLTVAKVRNGG